MERLRLEVIKDIREQVKLGRPTKLLAFQKLKNGDFDIHLDESMTAEENADLLYALGVL